MRILALKTIKEFYLKQPNSKNQLILWHRKISKMTFLNCSAVKEIFKDSEARCITKNRIVFNIHNNDFRLICHFEYTLGIAYVCFLGSHQEYDKIDAKTVWKH